MILEVAERMSWSNLNPGFFIYPGLFLYQVFLLDRLVSAFGGEPHHVLYGARLLTAAYSLVTVWLVYLIGDRLGGRRLGLLAAGIASLTGALTLHAHYAVTDTPATALATASVWLSVRGWQRRSYRGIVLAAVVAGLAVSTKYSVAPACFAPWLAAMGLGRRRAATTALLAAAAVAAFLSTSPFTLLDYRGFVRDLQAESALQARALAGEHDVPIEDPGLADRGVVGNAVAAYDDLGPAALVLALGAGGFLLAAPTRARRRLEVDRFGGLILVVWVVMYFLLMAPSAKFGPRYALPMYPALIVLAAAPVVAAFRAGRRRGSRATMTLACAAGVLVAVTPARQAIVSTAILVRPDTRLEARAWIIENLPPGRRLAREFYAPPMHDTDGFRLMQPFSLTDHSFTTYCDDDVGYLVLSSHNADRYFSGDEERFADQRGWYRELDANTRLLHRVEAIGDLPLHHPAIEIRLLRCGSGR